ncbi:hypothetical protein HMPREF1093_03978 [Hungatella hathewayi 12489931]|uniref:hypothetical protein n=1 Tax=Hungatella hathewayi TaxID=154046 RepID=UPI0002D1D2F1|nr:hypothetical protein [Hungatella hathewayi]ENY92251.1 hypothetical protein HMPREF1093_03978 [Hungatella hathewayi 12489931]
MGHLIRKKRIGISLIIAVTLTGGIIFTSACSAADGTPQQQSSRSDDETTMETLELKGVTYYLVFDETQLRAIGKDGYGLDRNYLQQADIELSSDEWVPIGTEDEPFKGSYNGNGFEIKGLTMADPKAEIIGLFGYAEDAHLYNITLRDYDIMSAGRDIKKKSVSPVLVFGMGKTRSYDNTVYPKK